MKNHHSKTIYGIIISTILTFSLLLAGCGKSTPEGNIPSAENKEESGKLSFYQKAKYQKPCIIQSLSNP